MGAWSDDSIVIDLERGHVAVRGPIQFVREIDWSRVEAVALLLSGALGPADALKVALWREYRGWQRRLQRAGGMELNGTRTHEPLATLPAPRSSSIRSEI